MANEDCVPYQKCPGQPQRTAGCATAYLQQPSHPTKLSHFSAGLLALQCSKLPCLYQPSSEFAKVSDSFLEDVTLQVWFG